VQRARPRTARVPSSGVILDVTVERPRFTHSARSQAGIASVSCTGVVLPGAHPAR
jgi:hypothetical protein